MKILTMYLPQFHHVKENDEWWGEGFTDWVAVKNAKPLFDGHYQPHIPMNHNYYDLLEKKTMQWQADLMHQYGVDGMCIYHYWFKDGRQILEKPLENLLKWKDIDMPFCFCWANETWARSWGNIKNANSWAESYERKSSEKEKVVLLDQDYGQEEVWEKHYLYFLTYIKDERYICYNGRPMLVIYRPKLIYCLQDMIRCWKKLAEKYNQKEFYIIGMEADGTITPEVDATMHHQPARGIANIKKRTGTVIVDYAEVWEKILQEKRMQRRTYDYGFVGYDDTPRRGLEKGIVVEGATPGLFKKYFKKLLVRNEWYKNEYVFLNAWNEWGEGMHLEPDEKYGTAYLEALYEAKKEYIEELDTYTSIGDRIDESEKITADKNGIYLDILSKWMSINRKCSVSEFLQKKEIFKVALYGWGIFAKQLVEEFRENGIDVVCIIDKNSEVDTGEYKLCQPENAIPESDIVIVCSFYYYYEIVRNDYDWCSKAVSFEMLLYEMENMAV